MTVGVSLVLSACGSSSDVDGATATSPPSPADPAEPDTSELRIALALGDILTLDPAGVLADAALLILPLVGDTLVGVDQQTPSIVTPGLAESWTVSDDGTVVTFSLRSDAIFPSGRTMTAEDVKFSFDRHRFLQGASGFFLDGIDEIVAVDGTTVEFRLTTPDSTFVNRMAATYVIPLDREELAANGGVADETAIGTDTAQAFLDGTTIGTGPYKLVEWVRNERMVFERRDDYWGDAPVFARITLLDVREAATRRQLLEGGDVEIITDVDPDTAAALGSAANVSVVRAPSYNLIYLAMNHAVPDAPELADVRVRRAIQLAIDYDGISVGLADGAPRPAAAVPLGFQGADAVEPVLTDVEAAKALMAEAGVSSLDLKVTFSNQVLYGVPLVTLWEKLQADLAVIGVNLMLNPVEYDTWIASFRAGELSFTNGLWAPDFYDAGGHLDVFGKPRGVVTGRVSVVIAGAEELNARYVAATSTEEKESIAREFITLMRDDASIFAVVQPNSIIAHNSRLTGVAYSPNKVLTIVNIRIQ